MGENEDYEYIDPMEEIRKEWAYRQEYWKEKEKEWAKDEAAAERDKIKLLDKEFAKLKVTLSSEDYGKTWFICNEFYLTDADNEYDEYQFNQERDSTEWVLERIK